MSVKEKPSTDPRVIRTRQLIRDAFVDLLQEMELEKISVNRIAERATINRVTFYLHYRDIPDMLEKLADEMTGNIQQILLPAPENQSSAEEYWPILVMLLEHIAANAKWYKVVLASRRTTIFTDRLLKLLTEMLTEKFERRTDHFLSKSGIQKDIAIWYSSSALIGTIVGWLRQDLPYTPRYLAEQYALMRTLPLE
ncbi:TetR/AcrR family transcriptional regulator [Paenibacillus sp. OV219]|uniref:TetR/AcrR family transcriptional regulator n=1 Tax=Paenibacillus sp. OV219 TaxID=1884377 RepID=UPI0008AFA7FC|nr:TetR-like C-terminal domain-containing protein [Paenibacillus sp. OV219]SEN73674.1 transcriptional regulator, TetR family [Paenibacillus sp. OV219]